jgi:hypothetical protein
MTWGIEANVIERFGHAGVAPEKISAVKDTFHFRSPDKSPADFIDRFRRFYGPSMNAFDAAEKNERTEELHRQLVELANSRNQASHDGTSIPATFLRVTVRL